MDNIAKLEQADRNAIFSETAGKMGLRPAIIEKDFWVCYVLNKIFSSDKLKDIILFKGGTSLSKVFKLIKRFSEDIDLILNWKVLTNDDPYEARSHRKQRLYNEQLRLASVEYINAKIVPILQKDLGANFKIGLDEDSRFVKIVYPAAFDNGYVGSIIYLEISPIASWSCNEEYIIKPFVEDYFPDHFSGLGTKVKAIKAERTFWEKITILHHEAHRPIAQDMPQRYSRHYYDTVMMSKNPVKENAYKDLKILTEVVNFKDKFYHQKWARYDLARPGAFKLSPPERFINSLEEDYKAMEEMIFDIPPTFGELMSEIKTIEFEINNLS